MPTSALPLQRLLTALLSQLLQRDPQLETEAEKAESNDFHSQTLILSQDEQQTEQRIVFSQIIFSKWILSSHSSVDGWWLDTGVAGSVNDLLGSPPGKLSLQ